MILRSAAWALVASSLASSLACHAAAQQLPAASASADAALGRGEWPAYAGTNRALRWSPLDLINKDNAGKLEVVWRWQSPDRDLRASGIRATAPFSHESTPIMIGRTLYTSTSLSQIAAIDAATGKTRWVFDPRAYDTTEQPVNLGWTNMGVAYWKGGDDERILILTGDGFLVAVDARTGRPVETFGSNGRIDLTKGLHRSFPRQVYTSQAPPLVVGDVVVAGSSIWDFWPNHLPAPGDVRGFDVRTGKLLWTFHTVPQQGEPGVETWEQDSWRRTGNANVWAPMSADEELGTIYLPVSTPSNDYYGGHRPGDGLYGESLVCLDAKTGRKVWHYQIVRHGLWDYDLPAAPNLVDIVVDGRPVKAVAQVTKQNFVFVFDRVTGQPVWPIEDRPVPPSTIEGERAAATQPFPTRPAPIDLQGIREEDLIDFTPDLRADALAILRHYDHGPLYTAPTVRGTATNPGIGGGANWPGAAVDPETGMLYVETHRMPWVIALRRPMSFELEYDYVGLPQLLLGPLQLPILKPPYTSLVAIDLNTGDHRWRVPLGIGPIDHPSLKALGIKERLGNPYTKGWALVSRSLLFAVQSGVLGGMQSSSGGFGRTFSLTERDTNLWVYDKATGELLAEIPVGSNASGAPMTYRLDGRQYIVFPVGGGRNVPEELVAVGLRAVP